MVSTEEGFIFGILAFVILTIQYGEIGFLLFNIFAIMYGIVITIIIIALFACCGFTCWACCCSDKKQVSNTLIQMADVIDPQ